MLRWPRTVALVNARVVTDDGVASSVRFASRVLDIGGAPTRADAVCDMDGAFVLPGLVNAHDHLELNHYGSLKRRERYENASQWIDDLRPVIRTDPEIRARAAHPLAARLFAGGLKNLVAGVTTVAHHNPRYREIGHRFPVRLVSRYGWAHSLAMQTEPVGAGGEPGGDVRARCVATPAGVPFIVHAAEGVDAAAAEELQCLEALGCLRPNTVLVHGVALGADEWRRVRRSGASLVWCPASNAFLFGRTAPVRQILDGSAPSWQNVCLGTDSRLTGARDLLEELRAAAAAGVRPHELLRMVTTAPARVLGLPHAGRIAVGGLADLMAIPASAQDPAESLVAAARRDVLLVVVGGTPMIAAPALGGVFEARGCAVQPLVVDEVARLGHARLARRIARNPIREPGVACAA